MSGKKQDNFELLDIGGVPPEFELLADYWIIDTNTGQVTSAQLTYTRDEWYARVDGGDTNGWRVRKDWINGI